jgi:CBS domain-containing protein
MAFLVSGAMVTVPKTQASDVALDEIRELFQDDHVRIALIVAPDGRLVTTLEREDLLAAASSDGRAARLGTLVDRTVLPSDSLAGAAAALLRRHRRRLAVVDEDGRLVGLLCLKRDGTGFCSDEGVLARASERAALGRGPDRTAA